MQHPRLPVAWGRGHWCESAPVDGIWMATNVPGSCAVWDAQIRTPGSVTDAHGGIEQLRAALGPGTSAPAGQLCWITDRTPHEAVPWQVRTLVRVRFACCKRASLLLSLALRTLRNGVTAPGVGAALRQRTPLAGGGRAEWLTAYHTKQC